MVVFFCCCFNKYIVHIIFANVFSFFCCWVEEYMKFFWILPNLWASLSPLFCLKIFIIHTYRLNSKKIASESNHYLWTFIVWVQFYLWIFPMKFYYYSTCFSCYYFWALFYTAFQSFISFLRFFCKRINFVYLIRNDHWEFFLQSSFIHKNISTF